MFKTILASAAVFSVFIFSAQAQQQAAMSADAFVGEQLVAQVEEPEFQSVQAGEEPAQSFQSEGVAEQSVRQEGATSAASGAAEANTGLVVGLGVAVAAGIAVAASNSGSSSSSSSPGFTPSSP